MQSPETTRAGKDDAATAKMDECQAKIDDNNERIEDLQGKLGNRANNMYRDGQTTFLDVILGSNSFAEDAGNGIGRKAPEPNKREAPSLVSGHSGG